MLLNWTKETWWPLKFACAISAFLLLSAGRWIEESLFSVLWYYSPDSRFECSAWWNFQRCRTSKRNTLIFFWQQNTLIEVPKKYKVLLFPQLWFVHFLPSFYFLLKELVENKLYMCWTEILSFFGSFSLCPEPQTKVRTVFIFIYTCKLVRLHSCIWIDWMPTKSVEHFCPLMNGKANLF